MNTTIEKSGGIGIYYNWQYEDSDQFCGHAHRDRAAAERCALRTIRAARRGEKFFRSERFAEMSDEAAVWLVERQTYSL